MWSCLTVWSFNSSLAKLQLNQRNIDRSLLWFINWTKCHATVDFVGTYQGFCWTWPDVWQIFQSINVDFFISTNIASDLLTLCNNLSFTNTVELYLNDNVFWEFLRFIFCIVSSSVCVLSVWVVNELAKLSRRNHIAAKSWMSKLH